MLMTGTAISAVWRQKQEKMCCSPLHTNMTETGTARRKQEKSACCEECSDGKNQFTYDRQGGIVEEKNAMGIRLFSYNSRHDNRSPINTIPWSGGNPDRVISRMDITLDTFD